MDKTFLDRMRMELAELSDRLDKLNTFLVSERFGQLDGGNRKLLNMQCAYMEAYRTVLRNRIVLNGG